MIAIDTSAILAIVLQEAEEPEFLQVVGASRPMIGAPTLVETRLALEGHFRGAAETVLREFIARHRLGIFPFDAPIFEAAIDAFARFGKGRHRARLNFGDCLSYAAAKVHALPLLFKGDDFVHTDLVPAHRAEP